MLEILNAFGILGINNFAAALYGLVRTKLLAYFTGPTGVGIVSQARLFLQALVQIDSLGSRSGVLKLIAEYQEVGETRSLRSFISTILLFFFIVSTTVLALMTIFARSLSVEVFDSPEYTWIIIVISASAIFLMEYNIVLSALQGLSEWRRFAVVSLLGYFLSALLTAVLVVVWDIRGAIFSFLISNLIILIIGLLSLNRALYIEGQGGFWTAQLSFAPIKQIGRFIGPLTINALILNVLSLVLRSEVIKQLGVDANGIYQVAWGTSIIYMGIFIQLFSSYGVAKITSSLKDVRAVNSIQNDLIYIGVLSSAPLTLFLLLLRHFWIPILYDVTFLIAGPLLVWQFIGDILRVIRLGIVSSLIPYEKFFFLQIDQILFWGGWIILCKLLMPVLGVTAVPVTYMFANLIMVPIDYLYHWKVLGYTFNRKSVKIIAKAAFLMLIGMWFAYRLEGKMDFVLTGLCLLGMIVWLPEKEDYRKGVAYLLSWWKRFRNRI
jgi:PST family polysaccharide transporter